MNTKEMIADSVRDFLESHPNSRVIRWVMVTFLLFCGIPQKTIAAVTNYTDRRIRNIRAQYEHSNGDFPREGKKRGRKKKIKKRIFGRIVKYIVDHPRSTLFTADMVKKTRQAFVAGSVEAILTLFFYTEKPVRV